MSVHTLDPTEKVPGLAFAPDGGLRVFAVKEYFRDFETGLRKWLAGQGKLRS